LETFFFDFFDDFLDDFFDEIISAVVMLPPGMVILVVGTPAITSTGAAHASAAGTVWDCDTAKDAFE